MKKAMFAFTAAAGLLLAASCSNGGEEKSDTVIIEKETETRAPAEDDGNSLKLDATVDEEGNVDGEVSGSVEIDDK